MSTQSITASSQLTEKLALFASLFFFAFGFGLMNGGKKLYAHQLKLSQRVDYRATLNPYQ